MKWMVYTLKVLQLTGSVSRIAGGPYYSIRRISQHMHCDRCFINVVGIRDKYSEEDLLSWVPIIPDLLDSTVFKCVGYVSNIAEYLISMNPDILHIHGIWMYMSFAAMKYRKKYNKQIIISPRGMLEPWAFNYHVWKKRPVWWAWERENVKSAKVLHATSIDEALSFKKLNLKNQIAVIPNGIDLPLLPSVDKTRKQLPKRILFLSRIHPKKGLINLIKAIERIKPNGWKVTIAGIDQDGHEQDLLRYINENDLAHWFDFVGPKFGEEKEKLFLDSDLFILPSYCENFGIAIAEAMSFGLPVITTKGTPWKILSEKQCGWWIDIGIDPLEIAIREAIEMNENERIIMGTIGRKYVEDNFCWPIIANQMLSVYEWLLGGGSKPDCVI